MITFLLAIWAVVKVLLIVFAIVAVLLLIVGTPLAIKLIKLIFHALQATYRKITRKIKFEKQRKETQKALESYNQPASVRTYTNVAASAEEEVSALPVSESLSDNDGPIVLQELPGISDDIRLKLVPITDKDMIASITQLVPEAASILGSASAAVAYHGAARAGAFYQAILPSGAELLKSADGNGLVRGMYRGTTGIAGHANLKPVDGVVSKMAAANLANLALSVISMVVGQYYLTRINRNLKKINVEISNISGFLHNEYYSKVETLVDSVQKTSAFFKEIMNNPEQREREITAVQNMERECVQLLNQANSQLFGYKNMPPQSCPDYEAYEKLLYEAQGWYSCQQILCEVLYNLANLNYALNMGNLSKRQCFYSYQTHAQKASDAWKSLHIWHDQQIERLGIDMVLERRHRTKDSVGRALQSAISGDYCLMESTTVELINNQCNNPPKIHPMPTHDPYAEPITIYFRGQSVYYLPDSDVI